MERAQGAVFTVITIARPSLPLLIPLIVIAASCATVFSTAGRTVVPRLVEEPDRMSANAWIGTAFNLQSVIGPLLGGLLAAGVGPFGALGANAASFFIGALLLLPLPSRASAAPGEERPGFLADVVEGLRYTSRHKLARAVGILLFFGILLGSLDNVVLVFFANDTLDSGALGFGALTAAYGAAMVVVSLWLTRSSRQVSPVMLLTAGWLVTGVGIALTGISPIIGLALAAQALAGLGNGAAMIGEDTVLQNAVPLEMLGRVGGAMSSAVFLASSLAYAVGAVVATNLDPRTTLVIAGVGLAVVSLLCAPAVRKGAAEAQVPPSGPVTAPEELGPQELMADPMNRPGGSATPA
jgi:MFS family permease